MDNDLLTIMLKDPRIILGVNNLKVWYPIRKGLMDYIYRRKQRFAKAVDGISFAVRRGETFCLAGESGCGKTTTGKSLLGLTPITEGNAFFRPRKEVINELQKAGFSTINSDIVDIFKLSWKGLKYVKRDITIIYQDPYGSLNPSATIKDILEEPLLIHGLLKDEEERKEIIYQVLEQVKLTPAADIAARYPHQLSGGQRQRVAIARAIITRPSLVVADEPVSMLDASIRAEILELMLDLKRKLNLTYIFITHDLAVARYICDRIAIMYLGKIVEIGDARRVIENPMHPYTQALVAAIPEPEPKNRLKLREVPIKGEVPSAVNIPTGCRFHPRCVARDKNLERLGDICVKHDPGLTTLNNDERLVACWLYRNSYKLSPEKSS